MPPKLRLQQLKLARTSVSGANAHAASITGTADDDDDHGDDDDDDGLDHDDEVAVSVAARESASRRSSFGVVVDDDGDDDDDDDDDDDAVPDSGDMSVDETGAGVLSASANTVFVFVFAHRATRSHDGSQGTPNPTRAVRSGVLSQTSAFAGDGRRALGACSAFRRRRSNVSCRPRRSRCVCRQLWLAVMSG
jgi:hypothetical protein